MCIVYPPSLVACRFSASQDLNFYPHQRNLENTSKPLSPRVVARPVWLVVRRCNLKLQWDGRGLHCPPSNHSQTHGPDLEAHGGQPQAPTTDPPAAASSPQNGAGLWPRTTHCGTASLPGRCGGPGRATTLSVAGRCPHNGGHCHQAAAGAAPQLHRRRDRNSTAVGGQWRAGHRRTRRRVCNTAAAEVEQ